MPTSAVPELHTSVPLGVDAGEEVVVCEVFEEVVVSAVADDVFVGDGDEVLEVESVMLSLMVIESVSPSGPITKG